MKKQNVLDLLCDDFINQYEQEKDNLYMCVNDESIDKNVKLYIIPFLEKHYKLFDLDFNFNINSSDEITKYKSMSLLCALIKGVYDLMAISPNYFKHYEKEFDTKTAYKELCMRVLLGNILDIKKGLKNINENMTNTFKEYLDNVKNIILNA